jgi:predicted ATPase
MIERIRIENFKSIRSLELDMRPLNVLIGANGAGKSNFISFFKLVNQIGEGRLQDYVARQSMENLLFFGKKTSDFIRGFLDFDNLNAYSFHLKPTADEGAYLEREVKLYNPHIINDQSKNYRKWNNWTETGRKESYLIDDSHTGARSLLYYLRSFKIYHFHDTSDSSKMKQPCNLEDNALLREDGSNLAAFLYRLQETEPIAYRKIEATVRSIAPFFDRFELKPRALNPDQILLEWREKGTDVYRSVNHFSDGTLRFIALTTLLLQPNPPFIILIDEPELGLHPAAIEKLAGLLRKVVQGTDLYNNQVILSTQSVTLVNEFLPEDIITVDRAEGQSVFTRWDESQLHDWLDAYSLGELWDKNVIGGRP